MNVQEQVINHYNITICESDNKSDQLSTKEYNDDPIKNI